MAFNPLTYLLALLLALAPVGGARASAPVAHGDGGAAASVESAHFAPDLPATLRAAGARAHRPQRVSLPAGAALLADGPPATPCTVEVPASRLPRAPSGRSLLYVLMSLQR